MHGPKCLTALCVVLVSHRSVLAPWAGAESIGLQRFAQSLPSSKSEAASAKAVISA